MKIFGMGGLEIVIILIVVLIIFGPKNLPKIGKSLGKAVSNLREGMNAGKKKEDAASDADSEGEGNSKSAEPLPAGGERPEKPIVIEADVEEVTFPDEPASEGGADAVGTGAADNANAEGVGVGAAGNADGEGADGASGIVDDVSADVAQMFDEAAAVGDAPKRVVKRVVRKKPAADDSADGE